MYRIRATFGQDIKANAVHGSSNSEHAQTAIKEIFGDLEFTADGCLKGLLDVIAAGYEGFSFFIYIFFNKA